MEDFNKDELLDKYNTGTASDDERALVESWYLTSSLFNAVPDLEQVLEDQARSKQLLVDYMQKSRGVIHLGRLAVAASIAIVLGIGLWFYMLRETESDNKLTIAMQTAADNIAPGKNKATLTLANGETIDLNEAKSGIVIDAGKLSYNDGTALNGDGVKNSSANHELLTASTPRGGTYQIILPDGSKVWLNAASTLRFPTTFSGLDQRVVSLNGEAYFEISKDKQHPFIVESRGQKVKVLGTHFNVDNYGDEDEAKTTLIEGSVIVSLYNAKQAGNKESAAITSRYLKPGEQSRIDTQASSIAISAINTEEVIAWKNGEFVFNDESFELIMKKMARWYNIDVVYEHKPLGQSFTGVISRDKKLSEVLNALIKTKKVKFRVEGRKVTVF